MHSDCISRNCTDGMCVIPTCFDGILNHDEVDVDCGGSCAPCATGKRCNQHPATTRNAECETGICLDSVCAVESCRDGLQNNNETCVDGGGKFCAARCPIGAGCRNMWDCADGGRCTDGVCQPPRCSDNLWNQGETATDCGGPACPHTCTLGRGCLVDDDCWSEVCSASRQRCVPPATCRNGVRDCWKGVCESGVDCGANSTCGKCDVGLGCHTHADCIQGVCGADGTCAQPSCFDGIMNGAEACVDAGATCLKGCPTSSNCTVHDDCASRQCWYGFCAAPTCNDRVRNADEAGVDCGAGSGCGLCDTGATCRTAADCESKVCLFNTCQAASHSDLVINAGESDVDCGGPDVTAPRCHLGKNCSVASDCLSGGCHASNSSCVLTDLCMNGRLDPGEGDTDCGGACAECLPGRHCFSHGDCQSDVCVNEVCAAPSCSDGVRNGGEFCIDGGAECDATCPGGAPCVLDGDCHTNSCVNNTCAFESTCGNGVLDEAATQGQLIAGLFETDVDCGGVCGPTCQHSQRCLVNGDCSGDLVCAAGHNLCLPPNCADGRVSGSESDVDCGAGSGCPLCGGQRRCRGNADCVSDECVNGFCTVPSACDPDECGASCAPCGFGAVCVVSMDCDSRLCTNSTCSARTCTDGVRNGLESFIDCGSPDCPKCGSNAHCFNNTQCASGLCQQGRCATGSSCTNRVRDGRESDVDCGGSECFACPVGSSCGNDGDCELGAFCAFGVCTSRFLTASITAGGGVGGLGNLGTTTGTPNAGPLPAEDSEPEVVPIVTGLPSRAGASGGGRYVYVSGRQFITVGAARYRCLGRPVGPFARDVGSPWGSITTCTVVNDETLQCDAAAYVGRADLRFQYRLVPDGAWTDVYYDGGDGAGAAGDAAGVRLTYDFTYVTDMPAALRIVHAPSYGVAGVVLPMTPTVEILDGAGRRVVGDNVTRVTITVEQAPHVDALVTEETPEEAQQRRRRLSTRGLSQIAGSDNGMASGGGYGYFTTSPWASHASTTGSVTAQAVNGVVTFHNVSVDEFVGGPRNVFRFTIAEDGDCTPTVATAPLDIYQPSPSLPKDCLAGTTDAAGTCCNATLIDECGVCMGGGQSCGSQVCFNVAAAAAGNITAAAAQEDLMNATALPAARIRVDSLDVVRLTAAGYVHVKVCATILPFNRSAAELGIEPWASMGAAARVPANTFTEQLYRDAFDPFSHWRRGNLTQYMVLCPSPTFTPSPVCGNGVCEMGEQGALCDDCLEAVAPAGTNGVIDKVPCLGGGGGGFGLPFITMFNQTGDRIPAIVSVTSATLTLAVLGLQTVQQAGMKVHAVAGTGALFGGVGEGVAGLDFGMGLVLDSAQFVMLSGALNATATPFVMRYFTEYFGPYTGLFPVAGLGHSNATAEDQIAADVMGYVPRAVTVLFKAGYWDTADAYGPHSLLPLTLGVSALLSVVVFVAAAVAALSPLCAHRRLPKNRLVYAVQYATGRVVGLWWFLYYLISTAVVYELWQSGGTGGPGGAFYDYEAPVAVGSDEGVDDDLLLVPTPPPTVAGMPMDALAWATLAVVLVLPAVFIALVLSCAWRRSIRTSHSGVALVLSPIYASFTMDMRLWGLLSLLDRFASAVVLVTAAQRPTLQVLILSCKAVAWAGLLARYRPARNSLVHSATLATAVYRALILGFTVAYIPHAASGSADDIDAIGWVMALVHVAYFLTLLLLALVKLHRSCSPGGRRRAKLAASRDPDKELDVPALPDKVARDPAKAARAARPARGRHGAGKRGRNRGPAPGQDPAAAAFPQDLLDGAAMMSNPMAGRRRPNPNPLYAPLDGAEEEGVVIAPDGEMSSLQQTNKLRSLRRAARPTTPPQEGPAPTAPAQEHPPLAGTENPMLALAQANAGDKGGDAEPAGGQTTPADTAEDVKRRQLERYKARKNQARRTRGAAAAARAARAVPEAQRSSIKRQFAPVMAPVETARPSRRRRRGGKTARGGKSSRRKRAPPPPPPPRK